MPCILMQGVCVLVIFVDDLLYGIGVSLNIRITTLFYQL